MKNARFLLALALLLGGLATAPAAAPTKADKELVAEVAKRLLAKMDPIPGFVWPPDIQMTDSDKEEDGFKLNAWAFADKLESGKFKPYVRITDLYLTKIVRGDKDVLAQVLGHELGHIHHRHVAIRIPGKTDFLKVTISRKREFEADAFGANLMKKARYSVIHGVIGASRFKDYTLHNAPLDSLRSTHPASDDRAARVVQNPKVWEALATFHNGVALLSAEQFLAATRCFEVVTKFDPNCYEAWVNLGHARLMQYCDNLSPSDLSDMGVGQLLCGAFYQRARSLAPSVRGKNKALFDDAIDALNEALKLKPGLTLARANLGLAALVHYDGKDTGEAILQLRKAVKSAADDKTLLPTDRVALQINLGAALVASGARKAGLAQLTLARATLEKLGLGKETLLSSATRYNEALALAAVDADEEDKGKALNLFEKYLRESDSFSAWWPVAYERYAELSKELKKDPLTKAALQRPLNTTLRMQYSVTLKGGKTVTLGEKTEAALERLGKPSEALEILEGSLKRYRFKEHGIEVLASDRVVAIFFTSNKSPALTFKPRALGAGKSFEVRVGSSREEFEKSLPGSTYVFRNLLESGDDSAYVYYQHLGLAVRFDESSPPKVVEMVLVQIPIPGKIKDRGGE